MNFISSHDAGILLAVFMGLASILVLWMKALKWPDIIKFAIVVVFCAVGGYLSAVASSAIVPTESLIGNGAIIYTAAYGIYTVFFRTLGLDKSLYPKAAIVKDAADAAQSQVIDKVSNDTAKQALNQDHPSTLVVQANVQNTNPVVVP